MSASEPVALSYPSDGVAVVTLNRPDRRNPVNLDIKARIADAVLALQADSTVRVIVLTGAGGYFIAGTDIAEMEAMTPAQHQALATDRMFTVLRRCPQILIAPVEGYALGGGCETALCCDMIFAGEGARFGQP